LMFIYEDPGEQASPDARTSLQLRQDKRLENLLEFLAGLTAEGVAYKVDLRLRPEGGVGLLARSWSSFLEHARKHMQPWERMALIRSRILEIDQPGETRRGAPPSNSPASERGIGAGVEGRPERPTHSWNNGNDVPHLRRSIPEAPGHPGLKAGPIECRPFGPG